MVSLYRDPLGEKIFSKQSENSRPEALPIGNSADRESELKAKNRELEARIRELEALLRESRVR